MPAKQPARPVAKVRGKREAAAKNAVAAKSAPGTKNAARKPNMFREMLRKVAKVPRSKVATYGDIAYAAGYPGAARQVAWALHAESEGLPWHRIVGAGGTILLTGESGFEQRMRLQGEGVSFVGLKVNMAAHRYKFFSGRTTRKTSRSKTKK